MAKIHSTQAERLLAAADSYLATEFEAFREAILTKLLSCSPRLMDLAHLCCSWLSQHLRLDRAFIVDSRNGLIVAGWSKGKNIVTEKDWDPQYQPLHMDRTLQGALEGDETIINPVPGEGADLAVPIHFDNNPLWLLALDQTDVARHFSDKELAVIFMLRDLIRLVAKFDPPA